MKAELYQDGSQVATIEAPPYQWDYDGDDERLLSVFRAAEDMSDVETLPVRSTTLHPSSPPEQQVKATPDQQFRTALEMARELGYFAATSHDAKAAGWDPMEHPRGPDGQFIEDPISAALDAIPLDSAAWVSKNQADIEEGDVMKAVKHPFGDTETKVVRVKESSIMGTLVETEDGEEIEVGSFDSDWENHGIYDPEAAREERLQEIEREERRKRKENRTTLSEDERREMLQENIDDLPAVPDEQDGSATADGAAIETAQMDGEADRLKDTLQDSLADGTFLHTQMDIEEVGSDADYGPFQQKTELAVWDNPNRQRAAVDVLVDPEDYANLQADIHGTYMDTDRQEHFGNADPDRVKDLAEKIEAGEVDDLPMPHVVLGENGAVQNIQEGRHRSLAAMAAGLDQIPVRIGISSRKDRDPLGDQ